MVELKWDENAEWRIKVYQGDKLIEEYQDISEVTIKNASHVEVLGNTSAELKAGDDCVLEVTVGQPMTVAMCYIEEKAST